MTTIAAKCPRCEGKGTYRGYYEWSDGVGGIDIICELCDGKKTIASSDLVSLLIHEKKAHTEAAHNLQALRKYVTLYLACSEGKLPCPPLKSAPGPSPRASDWLNYLKQAAMYVPKFTRKEWREFTRSPITGKSKPCGCGCGKI